MIPEGRLQRLIEQALDRQLERCVFHNVRTPMVSLLSDYECGREQIPSVVYQVSHALWHSYRSALLSSSLQAADSMLLPAPLTCVDPGSSSQGSLH